MGDTNGPFDPNYEIVRNLAVSHEELGDTALIHRRLESLQVRPLSQDSTETLPVWPLGRPNRAADRLSSH